MPLSSKLNLNCEWRITAESQEVFHLEPLCVFHSDFVYVKFLRPLSCYLSFFLFSPSSVMILSAFLSCFLVFLVKDQIASFQLKEILLLCFWTKVFGVCFYNIAWVQPSLNYNRFRVLHAVDSLNVKHDRKE